jgi:hypothetical protein
MVVNVWESSMGAGGALMRRVCCEGIRVLRMLYIWCPLAVKSVVSHRVHSSQVHSYLLGQRIACFYGAPHSETHCKRPLKLNTKSFTLRIYPSPLSPSAISFIFLYHISSFLRYSSILLFIIISFFHFIYYFTYFTLFLFYILHIYLLLYIYYICSIFTISFRLIVSNTDLSLVYVCEKYLFYVHKFLSQSSRTR